MNLTAKQQLSRNPSNAGYATPLKTYSVPAAVNEDKTISVPASPVFGIDPNHEPIDMYMAVRTIPGGTITHENNSFAITSAVATPLGSNQIQQAVVADIVASATVGNRAIYATLTYGSVVMWRGPTSAVVTAAQTLGYDISFGGSAGTSTTVRRTIAGGANTNVQVNCTCPITSLLPGCTLGFTDATAVDNADAVTWRSVYSRYAP